MLPMHAVKVCDSRNFIFTSSLSKKNKIKTETQNSIAQAENNFSYVKKIIKLNIRKLPFSKVLVGKAFFCAFFCEIKAEAFQAEITSRAQFSSSALIVAKCHKLNVIACAARRNGEKHRAS